MKKSLLLASVAVAGLTSAASAADLKVCVSWSNFREERWKTDEAAIKGALDAAGAEYISADAQTSATKQLADIEGMITQGCSALIILAQDSASIGPALDAAVLSSYKRGEPILFYYWSPTPLMGLVDLVKLDEKPGVDKSLTIKVGLSKAFHEQAPELVAVLEKVNLPIDLLNQNLGRMAKERIESPKLAKIFLKEHPEVWHAWVSDDAAKKIDAAL